jgi:hypothetical protein
VVDDAQTTEKSHVDGHVVFGDSVHGGRHKRSLEGDPLGYRRFKRDLGGGEALYSCQDEARERRDSRGHTDVAR